MDNPNEITNLDPSKKLLMTLKEAEKIAENPAQYKSYKNIEELKDALLSNEI